MIVSRQTANYIERMRPDRDRNAVEEIPRSPNGATWGKDLQVQAEETDYLGVAFGYRYRSEAILQDVPDDGSRIENPEQPSGRPGTRGAHVAFEYKGKEVSSVDLIGRDFVLLTGPRVRRGPAPAPHSPIGAAYHCRSIASARTCWMSTASGLSAMVLPPQAPCSCARMASLRGALARPRVLR
jgi:hypothetical protein